MKRLVTLLFFVVALMPLHASTADYQVVPLPRQITLQKGNPFVLTNAVQIVYVDGLQREAEFLKEYVGQLTGLQLQITNNRKAKKGIRLAINQKMTGQEAYRITVGQKEFSSSRRPHKACSMVFRLCASRWQQAM